MLIGGIEAGGTKMICAVGDENGTYWTGSPTPPGSPGRLLES